MNWTKIRVPVPREFLLAADPAAGDEQRMVLHPRLAGRFPLTLAGYDLGEWAVDGVELTMESTSGVLGGIPGSFTVPVYWVVLSRPLVP